ncbi:unnamed protein product [Closterium sp. NIES-54]
MEGAGEPGSKRSEFVVTIEEEAMSCRRECAVCLGEYAAGERIKVVPACAHGFHADCIDLWLAAKTTCPICRRDLSPGKAPPFPTIIPITQEAFMGDIIAIYGGVAEGTGGEGTGASVDGESAAAGVGGERETVPAVDRERTAEGVGGESAAAAVQGERATEPAEPAVDGESAPATVADTD